MTPAAGVWRIQLAFAAGSPRWFRSDYGIPPLAGRGALMDIVTRVR